MKRKVCPVAALVALTCGGALEAHHSISTIDTSTPVWVKGTVVRYELVNPHTIVEIDEAASDGQVKRWTIEGPALWRIERLDVDKTFLSTGDVIEVCGFVPKSVLERAATDPDNRRQPFIHGHLLVNADGQRSPWGSYGELETCVRTGDDAQSWAQFLNTNEFARVLWCNRYRTTVPTTATYSALVDEINRLMASPCPR